MTTNILIHGDSIFRGVVFDTQKEKYIYADNRIENQLAPIIDAKIINKSQFGNTVSRSAQKLAFNLEKYSPKFVIIELGGNDCDYDWKKVAQSPTQAHISNTDFPAFKVALREMIQTVRSYDIQPILSTIPPIDCGTFLQMDRAAEWAFTQGVFWISSVMFRESTGGKSAIMQRS